MYLYSMWRAAQNELADHSHATANQTELSGHILGIQMRIGYISEKAGKILCRVFFVCFDWGGRTEKAGD